MSELGAFGTPRRPFYNWRAKYGEMDMSMVARLKELEVGSTRLKKMYAEEHLKSEIFNRALTKRWLGHLAEVRWPSGWGLSVGYRPVWPA